MPLTVNLSDHEAENPTPLSSGTGRQGAFSWDAEADRPCVLDEFRTIFAGSPCGTESTSNSRNLGLRVATSPTRRRRTDSRSVHPSPAAIGKDLVTCCLGSLCNSMGNDRRWPRATSQSD